jgi:hypothetical protein
MGNSGKRPLRDYPNYYPNPNNINHDGMISAADFRQGACGLGFGFIDADIAQSAFNKYDHNRRGYLNQNDAFCAYDHLHRLYS